jgi:hypothetical protein
MNRQNAYTFEEVKQVMTTNRPLGDLTKVMGRSYGALNMLKWQAKMFQAGNMKVVSRPLQEHFKRFFTNKGDMKLEETAHKASLPTPNTSSDVCEHQLEEAVERASETFASLQEQMRDIARLSAQHQLHSSKDELAELQAWKKQVEPELTSLREFRDRAKKGNFASMLRSDIPF